MPVKFLTVKQALEYFDTLDSDEYSDDGSIICLPPDPGVVTDEEDIIENDIFHNTDIPKDVSGEVEVSFKKRTKKKLLPPPKPEKERELYLIKKNIPKIILNRINMQKIPKEKKRKVKPKIILIGKQQACCLFSQKISLNWKRHSQNLLRKLPTNFSVCFLIKKL